MTNEHGSMMMYMSPDTAGRLARLMRAVAAKGDAAELRKNSREHEP
jgi:hypothetical protein